MKQTITDDQLNELSDAAKRRLHDWYVNVYAVTHPIDYYEGWFCYLPLGDGLVEAVHLPCLTIGALIEYFLTTDYYRSGADKHWLDIGGLDHVIEDRDHTGMDDTLGIGWKGEELCDRLWECVRAALEREDLGAMKSPED